MIDITKYLDYQLKNTTCEFVSFKNNRFGFVGQFEKYRIRGYINHATLLENVILGKKKTSEVYRYGVYKIKDFDSFEITDMETGEILEKFR